jgi:peptidoglycan/xylan/chitin deacetylase (PgdA/CDA1 family)
MDDVTPRRQIHMLHGCAPRWSAGIQSLRNYVPEAGLRCYLESRAGKYEEVSAASARDALTVDDSTVGGARACSIAREYGHEVTLFINPAQVARQRPYWFTRLDAILDARVNPLVHLEGRQFELSPGRPLRTFRLWVKSRLMALDEAATDSLLDELTKQLSAQAAVIPEHGQTVSITLLRELIQQGVRIGSHGWDHRDIASLDCDELMRDLQLASGWFEASLGLRPADYAVPYGLTPMPSRAVPEVTGMILLANPELPPGYLGSQHWNRRDITADLQRQLV